MKLIIERPSYHSTITIEKDYDDLTLPKIISDLIIPALKAIEYSEENIYKIFGER